jgi:hypothetical protein
LRLLATYHGKKRSRFIDAAGLGQARTAQPLRTLKPRTRPQQFFRMPESVRVSPCAIMRDRDRAEKHRHVRVQWAEMMACRDREAIPLKLWLK